MRLTNGFRGTLCSNKPMRCSVVDAHLMLKPVPCLCSFAACISKISNMIVIMIMVIIITTTITITTATTTTIHQHHHHHHHHHHHPHPHPHPHHPHHRHHHYCCHSYGWLGVYCINNTIVILQSGCIKKFCEYGGQMPQKSQQQSLWTVAESLFHRGRWIMDLWPRTHESKIVTGKLFVHWMIDDDCIEEGSPLWVLKTNSTETLLLLLQWHGVYWSNKIKQIILDIVRYCSKKLSASLKPPSSTSTSMGHHGSLVGDFH